MKKLFSVALLSALGYAANAQQSSSASQAVQLQLNNVIDITFTANGSDVGPLVEMPFSTINDYVNGVESANQEIRVRSNKAFNVFVRTNAEFFSYTGGATPTPSMPVAGVLSLIVVSDLTGGTVPGPFSTSTYYTLRDFNQDLINNGTIGSNQLFTVKYKATPGFSYPAGVYDIGVVYTATQL
jgi:hypothetical protein